MLAEVQPVGSNGTVVFVTILPFILLIGLIGFMGYFIIKLLKTHFANVRTGKSRKFNRVFLILCALGILIEFLLISFINAWDFRSSEIIPSMILLFILGIITQCLYFIPYLVANKKGHPQETAIFILNLFAGWTIIAWIIALVWAFTQPKITNSQQALIGNADELLKYKQLLDNDVISQEEFDTKKKQILDM